MQHSQNRSVHTLLCRCWMQWTLSRVRSSALYIQWQDLHLIVLYASRHHLQQGGSPGVRGPHQGSRQPSCSPGIETFSIQTSDTISLLMIGKVCVKATGRGIRSAFSTPNIELMTPRLWLDIANISITKHTSHDVFPHTYLLPSLSFIMHIVETY